MAHRTPPRDPRDAVQERATRRSVTPSASGVFDETKKTRTQEEAIEKSYTHDINLLLRQRELLQQRKEELKKPEGRQTALASQSVQAGQAPGRSRSPIHDSKPLAEYDQRQYELDYHRRMREENEELRQEKVKHAREQVEEDRREIERIEKYLEAKERARRADEAKMKERKEHHMKMLQEQIVNDMMNKKMMHHVNLTNDDCNTLEVRFDDARCETTRRT